MPKAHPYKIERDLKPESHNNHPAVRGGTVVIGSSGRYKRVFDLSILALAHVLLLPLWIILWTTIPFLIWLGDRGPVFYRQKRKGKDGRIFTLLKFRTMAPDADLNGPRWTMENDPRVTRLGKILRRTALDELPELVNIWKGEMSLVGPRALDVDEHEMLEQSVPGFLERLQVLPGLTGLAQLYDRDDTAIQKLRYDVEYIQKLGPGLDLKLLILSVLNTLGARWDRRDGKPPGGTVSGEKSSRGKQRDQVPEEIPAEVEPKR